MEIFDDFISDKPVSEAAWKGKLLALYNALTCINQINILSCGEDIE